METPTLSILRLLAALLAGGAVGFTFGLIQRRATRRHARLQEEGRFKTGWAATPGSFRRVAYLLVALAIVQFIFPMLFTTGTVTPWVVSAGVVLGYGWVLFGQLKQRRA
jgi:hypothetical protein